MVVCIFKNDYERLKMKHFLKRIDEDTLLSAIVSLVAITSFCLVIGGYKLFCFVETLTYPSINENVSIGKCNIHNSYCIEKTNKPFSYSLGKSGAGCYCLFYWKCKNHHLSFY